VLELSDHHRGFPGPVELLDDLDRHLPVLLAVRIGGAEHRAHAPAADPFLEEVPIAEAIGQARPAAGRSGQPTLPIRAMAHPLLLEDLPAAGAEAPAVTGHR